MRITPSIFTDPPQITNERPETRVSVLNDIEALGRRSLAHNRLKHILEAKRATKYHKMCLSAKNRIKRIAKQETNCYAPKRPRVIQSVFLSKFRLLIALDRVFRRKRDWVPRDWFLSPNLPETHFKVKRAITLFFRARRSTAICVEEGVQPTLS